MRKMLTGWSLCLLSGGPVLAGPATASIVDPSPIVARGTTSMKNTPVLPEISLDAAQTGSIAAQLQWPPSADAPQSDSISDLFEPRIESLQSADDGQPHPMIPLPTGAWIGFITLGFVAHHAVRQQRATRAYG